VDVGVGTEAIKRQIFHLLVARVELEREVFVGVIVAEMRAAGRKFSLGEPKLPNGHDAGKFETILPNVAVQIAAIVAAATDTAAGNNALGNEMKRPGPEGAGGAGKKRVFAELRGHVVAVLFPLIPIVGAGDRGVTGPHRGIGGRAARRDLSEDAGSGHRGKSKYEKESGE